jgi:hypothetical protein
MDMCQIKTELACKHLKYAIFSHSRTVPTPRRLQMMETTHQEKSPLSNRLSSLKQR